MEKYEDLSREARRDVFMERIKETEKQAMQIKLGQHFVHDLQREVQKLQEQIKNYKIEIATLVRADESSMNKVAQLREELNQTKYQLASQINETKDILQKLKSEEEACK